MRKPAFCICENKDADQLRGNCEADQRLCFRYTDSTIPLLPKYKISRLWLCSAVCAGPGRKPEDHFSHTRLISWMIFAELSVYFIHCIKCMGTLKPFIKFK